MGAAEVRQEKEIARLREFLGRIATAAFANDRDGILYLRELARCALAGDPSDVVPTVRDPFFGCSSSWRAARAHLYGPDGKLKPGLKP